MVKWRARSIGVFCATLFICVAGLHAGLIELVASRSAGSITLSIEGTQLRLTDHTNGTRLLRVTDLASTGGNVATQLGLAGSWEASSILTVPLQSDPILPATRLDDLFGGAGLNTSGNALNEIRIIARSGHAMDLNLDSVDVIGGTIPEPTSVVTAGMMGLLVLTRRLRVKF